MKRRGNEKVEKWAKSVVCFRLRK